VSITTPSFVGATTGTYYDGVVPLNSTNCASAKYLWADLAVASNAATGTVSVGLGDAKISVAINSLVMPAAPTIPIYMQVESEGALVGHNLSTSSNVSVQGPLVQLYVNSLRSNRVEPFKQNLVQQLNILANGTLDIANFSTSNASFQQLVMNGAIGGVMFQTWFGATAADRPSTAYLQAIDATIVANSLTGAWTYLWDEPTSSDMAEVEARAALVHQYAPHLKVMVTTVQTSALLSLVDIFTPIVTGFNPSGYRAGYWLYTSCEAHGSCSNATVGQLTGNNDLMVDDPAAHAIAYPLVVKASGGSAALYYDTMYAYISGNSPWTNQYYFGGNGDGNLFYPGTPGQFGLTVDTPIPSLRLKLLRQGSYITDYVVLTANSSTDLSAYVTSVTSWSKNADDYRALKFKLVGFTP
jgi:hypothetical protein